MHTYLDVVSLQIQHLPGVILNPDLVDKDTNFMSCPAQLG